jgi:VWFA-related protein
MKISSTIVFLSVSFLFSFTVSAQKTQPTPNTDDDVVKITTDLVQVDAVVTDKDGNPAKNLTAADFEIFQDGKLQQITSLNYINTELPEKPDATAKSDKNAPPTSVRLENAGRILTFVIDDGNCRASRIGMAASRDALEKFINQQMRPDDLVAIYQTRAGSSVLQQYTSDKAQLMRVARKIRWYPPKGICGNDAGGDFFDPARTTGTNKIAGGAESFESEKDRESRGKIENRAQDNQVHGFIGVLRYITRGLQRVAGRKTVFVLSDGLPLFSIDPTKKGSDNSPVSTMKLGDAGGAMLDLIDLANRASVIFHTIDVRGVFSAGEISAQDDFEGFRRNINATAQESARRNTVSANAQSGMFYLANETGGRFYHSANNLDVPLRSALNLEKGYYLIGYQPDENTFKSKKYNKIEIKMKRPDLSVRTRSGFFGVTDESLRPRKRTGDSELYEALVSPLPNAGLDLRVTAFFGNTPSEGSFVRTFLYLDGEQITVTDAPNSMKQAVFDVIAVTLNEKNELVDEFNRTHTIRFPAANLAGIRQNGMIYTADVPAKKPGAYNFRVAVRDVVSKKIGSAGQQVEVPDLKKADLFLSGLTIGEVTIENGKPVIPSTEKSKNEFSLVASLSIPSIRRFKPGALLGYSYKIYNAEADKSTRQPKLTVQIRLYRDGQVITESEPQPAQIEPQNDLTRLGDYGYMRLPPDALIGDYVLQIVIRDLQKDETASHWIDFEVVK